MNESNTVFMYSGWLYNKIYVKSWIWFEKKWMWRKHCTGLKVASKKWIWRNSEGWWDMIVGISCEGKTWMSLFVIKRVNKQGSLEKWRYQWIMIMYYSKVFKNSNHCYVHIWIHQLLISHYPSRVLMKVLSGIQDCLISNWRTEIKVVKDHLCLISYVYFTVSKTL